MNYQEFVKNLDLRLEKYFDAQKEFIVCREGCSACCEKGDYPLTQVELEYLMQGYIALDNNTKQVVQNNIKTIEKGGKCPFLIEHKCSVYPYRPVVCRTHGLAYLCKEDTVKVPHCVNEGKNFTDVYSNGEITIDPIKENLDTLDVLKDFPAGEMRNLADWLM